MRKHRNLILSPLILLAIAFGAYRWADTLQRSVLAYRSPLAGVAIQPGEPLESHTRRVVLVIVSGLSYEETVVQDMPLWQSLAAIGAAAATIVQPPAYWPSVWTTLLTGAGPELSDASLLEPAMSGVRSVTLDSLLAAARDAGLQTAVAASSDRAPLFPATAPDAAFFAHEGGVTGDAQVVEAALGFIADQRFNLVIVHLNQPAETGRAEGAGGQAYRGALRQIDSHLRQIIRQMDLSESVLVLISDGALLGDGRAAGGEDNPPNLPIVLVGQRVIVGTYSPVQLVDVAPTIVALLGTRLPSAVQGKPLFDMLQITEGTLASDRLRLAAHSVSLGEAYATAVGRPGLSQVIHQDLATAVQLRQSGNQAGAAEAARLAADETAAEIASARSGRVASERRPRLVPMALGLVMPLLWFWARRPPHFWLAAASALLAWAVFYGLYRLEGNILAFRDMSSVYAGFGVPLVRNAAIGLMIGILPLFVGLVAEDQRRWLISVSVVYDYGLLAGYLSLIPVLFAYWQHGAWISWYLPGLALLVLHGLALREMAAAAALSTIAPWLVGAVVWGVGRRGARVASQRGQSWDPIAHLRRQRGGPRVGGDSTNDGM